MKFIDNVSTEVRIFLSGGLLLGMLMAAGSVQARTLAGDDFLPRGPLRAGSMLLGHEVQTVAGGTSVYTVSGTQVGNSNVLFEVGTREFGARPSIASQNSTNALPLPEMPARGTVRFEARFVIPELDVFSGVVQGVWIGFTSADANLMNNIAEEFPHVTLRYIPRGGADGRINVQTFNGINELDSLSPVGSAVYPSNGHEYLLELTYDFDNNEVEARVEDTVTGEEAALVLPLGSDVRLTRAQLDMTGLDPGAPADELPYWKSFRIVEE